MSIPLFNSTWSTLAKKLESSCRKALFDFNMLEGPSSIGVALSGGEDSLTLLFLLKAIIGRGFPPCKIFALHVTGAFSCGASIDIHYLKSICDTLEVELFIAHAHQKLEDLECYTCSRQRRSLLFELTKQQGASTLAFGHHQDDHVQTLLMNLLHKAEFAGNLPKIKMHHYGITIIRPLIYIRKKDIHTFAIQQNFARIMCRCPVGQTSMRRQVEDLLQCLEEKFPNARINLAKAALIYGSQKASSP